MLATAARWRWWRLQWLRMIVVVVVWGSAGLVLCTYWQIPLSPNTYQSGKDLFQPPHSHNGNSSYPGSQRHDSDIGLTGDVQSYLEHTNDIEHGDEYQPYYNLKQEASDINYKSKYVNNLKPLTSALQAHQSGLRYNNSLKSQEINLGHLANEVFIRKGVRSPSLSESHQSYKNNSYYENSNTLVHSPASVNVSSLRKKAGHRENLIIVAGERDETELKINGSSRQNQGAPRVILLLTSWRSGSTFLGELLATAVPETFYSYEPLHPWKIRVLEEDDSNTRAAHVLLRDLFQCHMEPHAGHVAYMARSHWYLRWNTHLASQCTAPTKGPQGTQDRIKQYQESQVNQQEPGHEKQLFNASQEFQKVVWQIQESQHEAGDHDEKVEVVKKQPGQQDKDRHKKQQEPSSPRVNGDKRPSCDDASFVSDVCLRSSLHVAKVVRLSLRQVVPLLEDKHLSLQVVYLVRDPRAVLSSRSRLPWCVAAACRDPYTVCSSLQRDLLLLPRLLRRFPTRIKMILYEEFLQDLPLSLRDLLAFLHLPLASSHLAFLSTTVRGLAVQPPSSPVQAHVSRSQNQGPYGTRRNLKNQAFLWRLKTPYKQAARYQTRCKGVLTSLRLRQFTSSLEYHSYSISALLPRPRRLPQT